jgi:hypothetical protein
VGPLCRDRDDLTHLSFAAKWSNRCMRPHAAPPKLGIEHGSESQPQLTRASAAMVKGFGCRPVVTYPRALRAGVRNPPQEEPAGDRVGGLPFMGI